MSLVTIIVLVLAISSFHLEYKIQNYLEEDSSLSWIDEVLHEIKDNEKEERSFGDNITVGENSNKEYSHKPKDKNKEREDDEESKENEEREEDVEREEEEEVDEDNDDEAYEDDYFTAQTRSSMEDKISICSDNSVKSLETVSRFI